MHLPGLFGYVTFAATIAAAMLIFGGLPAWERLSKPARRAWAAACTVLLAVLAWRPLEQANYAVHHLQLWDFICFWLYGRVAVTSHGIYNPAAFHALAQNMPATHTYEFTREILDVGFPYPPFTIPLIAPLGLFASPAHALLFHYLIDIVAVSLTAVLVWQRFFRTYGRAGLLASALSIIACGTVEVVVVMGQTVLFLLLFLVLVQWESRSFRRGIWLGLACAVKPFALLLFLYPLVRGRWRELAGGITSLATMFAIAIAIAGVKNVVPYFTSPPFTRAAPWVFTEITNQSLRATMLRAGMHPGEYAAVAAVLLLLALAMCRFSRDEDHGVCNAGLIAIALLVYPATQPFYAPVLLLSLWSLWDRRMALGQRATAVCVAYGVLLYTLMSPRFAAVEILACVLTLCVCVWALQRRRVALEPVHMPKQVVGEVGHF